MHSFFAWDAFLFFMDIPKLDLVDLDALEIKRSNFGNAPEKKLHDANSENIIVQ